VFINLDGLLWLIVMLAALVYLQRRLHFESQAIFLLLTRRTDLTLALFSLLFLPGVFLHEISHFIMARLLGVRTGRFSILPQTLPDGRLQLGYVETTGSDFLRDGLIGVAPLLVGSGLVGYIGLVHLDLQTIRFGTADADLRTIVNSLSTLPSRPDFWLWFYLLFAVSSTMLPSNTDRRAWLPIAVFASMLLLVAILVGAGPWMVSSVAPKLNQILHVLALIFAISVSIHLLLFIPLWLARRFLSKLTKLQVV
jgi:hypothetical protein